ncbi:MAG: hypothetical protein JNM42_07770 [Propionivibrio sp.]|uniref:hypothetical protein n=1 Tax=Propionivibrio sp. TaxID=2212460 RepID=UPI001A3CEDF9|nr:hypothetical protein [Propionivibrio sp.]MBL8414318.1 hypothetical protein [Propionivibrio sp.]
MIPGYFFPETTPVFLVDLADFAGFPLPAFLFFPLACCLAGVVECFGLATLAPLVTGASSCSAAFGVASEAILKKQHAAAKRKCGIFFVRNFISSCPVPLSVKCLQLSSLAKVRWQVFRGGISFHTLYFPGVLIGGNPFDPFQRHCVAELKNKRIKPQQIIDQSGTIGAE